MTSSISLPNWQYSRLKALSCGNKTFYLYRKYKTLLRYAARSKLVSDRQTLYNKKIYSYKIQTVNWDIGMYNRLRMAAHRLKVSLSFLVHLIMLHDEETDEESSYQRFDRFEPIIGLIFTEIINYPEYPPD